MNWIGCFRSSTFTFKCSRTATKRSSRVGRCRSGATFSTRSFTRKCRRVATTLSTSGAGHARWVGFKTGGWFVLITVTHFVGAQIDLFAMDKVFVPVNISNVRYCSGGWIGRGVMVQLTASGYASIDPLVHGRDLRDGEADPVLRLNERQWRNVSQSAPAVRRVVASCCHGRERACGLTHTRMHVGG